MLKKILTLIIAAALGLSLASPAYATKMPSDISGHWAESMIRLALTLDPNLFSSEPHLMDRFEPDKPMMRVELCGVLNRLNNFTEEADVKFTDVRDDSAIAKELRIAVKAGYIKGDDQGRANPQGLLTRAEAATMLHRIGNYPKAEGESAKFKDSRDIPSWAIEAVDACVKKGIFKGDNEQRFRPNDTLTRAEIVALVYNLVFN